jgi:hypothetical protein
MTQFGKIMVFVTLAFSLLLLGWAVGIYTNRIDWSNTKATAEKAQGELSKREDRLRQVSASRARAETIWADNYLALTKAEAMRRNLGPFYQDELKKLESGPEEVKAVKYENGAVVVNADGKVQFDPFTVKNDEKDPGSKLQYRKFYVDKLAQVEKDIAAEADKLKETVEQEKALTLEIDGDADKKIKGIRQRIQEEQVELEKIKEELQDLKGVEVKARDEELNLQERRQQLRERVKELERIQQKLGAAASRL